MLLVLERVGLISINRDVTPPPVLMSSPLQAAIKLAAPAEFQEPAARAAANALLEVWPADEPQPWAAASLRANVASLQDSAVDALWADGCHPLLLRVGRSLDEARLVGPAVDFWSDLAARCDAKLAPGHPDTLAVAAQLAAAYLAAGNAAEAVQWYQRVLADRTRELTPGHPGILAARVSLARALIMASEPADAVTVMLRAVGEYEQFRGDGHPETLSARDELATAYQAAGDYAAAARLLARSLADRERLQGPRDPLTMATRERLAAACLAEGRSRTPSRTTSGCCPIARRCWAAVIRIRSRPPRACPPPIRRPDGCRPRCSSPSGAARIRSGSSVPTTRTRWPAWSTWLTCTTPWAGSETRWRCCTIPRHAVSGPCRLGTRLTQVVHQSLANLGEELMPARNFAHRRRKGPIFP